MTSIIEVNNLKKFYKRKTAKENGIFSILKRSNKEIVEAVKGIDFEIKKGEIVGFIGLNGAGKSTTIKLITGIMCPDEGEVKVNGLNSYKNRTKIVKDMGIMFGQRSNLLWDLPFINSLELLKKVYKVSDKTYNESLEMADKYLNVKKLLNVPIRNMSLGQRMKCEFTAITLHQPDIYVLDEPTIGLDVITRNQINDFLKYLNKEKNISVFMTTHDIKEIEKLCTRVIVINKGQILLDGNINDLLNLDEETYIEMKFSNTESLEKLVNNSLIEVVEKDNNNIKIKLDNKPIYKKIISEIVSDPNLINISISKLELEDVVLKLYEKALKDEAKGV